MSSATGSCNARPSARDERIESVRALVGVPRTREPTRACTSRAKAGLVARRPWEPYVAVTAAPEAPVRTPLPPRAPRGPPFASRRFRPEPRLVVVTGGRAPREALSSTGPRGFCRSRRRAREVHLRPAPSGAARPGVRWLVSDSWSSVKSSSREPTRGCGGRAVPSVHDRVLPAVVSMHLFIGDFTLRRHRRLVRAWMPLPTRVWTCSCLSAVSRWRSWTTAGDT